MGRIDVLKEYGIPVEPHLEQLARIKRWKKRIDAFRYGNNAEDEIPNQIDFIYAFFVNCYHLRDFLAYSKVISSVQIDQFFKDNLEMQICRDLCLESKHCSVTNPSFGEVDPETKKKKATEFAGVSLIREYDPFQEILKYDNPIKNIKYVVLANSEKHDVFELADKCVKLWEDFLKKNNCLGNKS